MPRRKVRWRFYKLEFVSLSDQLGDAEVCCFTDGPQIQEVTDGKSKNNLFRSKETALPGPEAGKNPLLLPDRPEVRLNLSNVQLALQSWEDIF